MGTYVSIFIYFVIKFTCGKYISTKVSIFSKTKICNLKNNNFYGKINIAANYSI